MLESRKRLHIHEWLGTDYQLPEDWGHTSQSLLGSELSQWPPYTEVIAPCALRCTQAGVGRGRDLMKLKTTCFLFSTLLHVLLHPLLPLHHALSRKPGKNPTRLKGAKSCQSDPHPYLFWVKGYISDKSPCFSGMLEDPEATCATSGVRGTRTLCISP